MKKLFKSKYSLIAFDLFVVLCAVILFEKVVGHVDTVFNGVLETLNYILAIITPLLYAAAITFVLKPSVNWFEKRVYSRKPKVNKDGEIIVSRTPRALAIFTVYVLIIGFLIIAVDYIVPQVLSSGKDFVNELPKQIKTFESNLDESFNLKLEIPYRDIAKFIKDNIESNLSNLNGLQSLSITVLDKARIGLDIFIGIIMSFYILAGQDEIYEWLKKLIYVIFKRDIGEKIIRFIDTADNIFEKFITGKAIDSTVVGVICFAGLSMFGLKYALLGSVIIGSANMIPFFGPILGSIPVILLCLLQEGVVKALLVALFVFVLQQIDGMILEPRVLGIVLGLNPLVIILSVTIGGALFGIAGMFLAVPTVAVLKIYFTEYFEKKYIENNEKHFMFDRLKK